MFHRNPEPRSSRGRNVCRVFGPAITGSSTSKLSGAFPNHTNLYTRVHQANVSKQPAPASASFLLYPPPPPVLFSPGGL